MRHVRGRTRVCGGRLFRPKRYDRGLVKAPTVKSGYKGEDPSDKVLFDVDKGWAPNAQELAEQIQSAIEETQGSDHSPPAELQTSGGIVYSSSWEVSSTAAVVFFQSHSHLPIAVHSTIG